MLTCKICYSEVPDTWEKCPTCGAPAGPPNVRAAESVEARRALDERYQKALDRAQVNGSLSMLEKFDESVRQSSAVINVNHLSLIDMILSPNALYGNYNKLCEGQARKPAALDDDRERRGVEAIFFGGYAQEIRYAALSLDDSGLKSYGPYAMKLREVAISSRATVLEDNSYSFALKHGLKPGNGPPPGYIASWESRHKLAVAKLAERISAATDEADFARLLLFSEGDRATDEFIEVHIYGTFDRKALESVKGNSAGGSEDEQAFLPIVKPHLRKAGIAWVEG